MPFNGKEDRKPAMPRGRLIGSGIDWNFPLTEGLLNNRGEDLIHETGIRCTCGVDNTYAGQLEQTHVARRRTTLSCKQCAGDGYLFRNARKIIGLVTGIAENRAREPGGWAEPGDCIASVRPGYQVTAGDMITFTWAMPLPDGQVIMRGAGTTGENSTRQTFLEANEDRLHYCASDSIWCEDEDGKVYDYGDFTFDGSKIIRWIGNQPLQGQKYIIKYNAYLEWIAFIPPNVRVDRGRDLGSRVLLRKRHVALINDDPRMRFGDKVPFCARIQP
jgi:hypothetical protein